MLDRSNVPDEGRLLLGSRSLERRKKFGNCPGSRESWMSGARDVVLGFGGAV